MKRLHIHLAVTELEQNIRFYSTLFQTQPTIQESASVRLEQRNRTDADWMKSLPTIP